MSSKYEVLKLENQLCFPLYAASKEIIKQYRNYLEPFGLTYTQYITLMVLWENKTINVKTLGEKLYLDSGTLTPLLKNLEAKEYIKRFRSKNDERNLIIELTKKGENLKDQLLEVPNKISECGKFDSQDALTLYTLLYKLLNNLKSNK